MFLALHRYIVMNSSLGSAHIILEFVPDLSRYLFLLSDGQSEPETPCLSVSLVPPSIFSQGVICGPPET